MNLNELKENSSNPRFIKDEKFKKLVQSIKDFPKMMELRPIIVDNDNVILGGNMRFKALKELKYKEIPDNWVKQADTLTEDEKKRFIITDNVGFGEWDFDMLANEWNEDELKEWGMDLPVFENEKDDVDLSNNLETHYRIEIILKDENTQEKLYNELIERDYECRILTL